MPAEPARAHVLALVEAGVSLRRIPVLAGVPRSTIGTLLKGKKGRPPARYLSRSTADRLLGVPIPGDPLIVAADHDHVPAIGAQRRLRALVAAGWTMAALSAELGMRARDFSVLIHHAERITAARHCAVSELFARLQLTPGPSDRARIYARRRCWALPMQWDEDTIDDPDATAPAKLRRAPYRTTARVSVS
ncbi:hypothetical protein [Nocardia sp. NPDC051750]|uniref:hypothetical protein n=1 Tax=Nocardia sp. NPDC051750 TaxID=3364325 RepID=UPI00378A2090